MRVFAMHGAVLSIESTHLGTLNLQYKILPLSSFYDFLITFKTTNSQIQMKREQKHMTEIIKGSLVSLLTILK